MGEEGRTEPFAETPARLIRVWNRTVGGSSGYRSPQKTFNV